MTFLLVSNGHIVPFFCVIRMRMYSTTAAKKARTEEIMASTNKNGGKVRYVLDFCKSM